MAVDLFEANVPARAEHSRSPEKAEKYGAPDKPENDQSPEKAGNPGDFGNAAHNRDKTCRMEPSFRNGDNT